jgi:hypothetical protein
MTFDDADKKQRLDRNVVTCNARATKDLSTVCDDT